MLSIVLNSLDESKAEDLVALDISGKSALADHMVVASGRSHRHVNAVADHLLRTLKDAGFGTSRVEGLNAADWVLIDTGDVIIHVFRPEVREFYAIEKMWAEDDLTENDTLH
ncbi:MAG: ribosome silencing factor [Pseudomonadota bacterium]